MIYTDRKWLYSMVMFHGGHSYSIRGLRFKRNIPKRVDSFPIRKKLEGVKGFQIQDFYEDKPKPAEEKKPEPTVEKAEEEKVVSTQPLKLKKRAVKRVKKEDSE